MAVVVGLDRASLPARTRFAAEVGSTIAAMSRRLGRGTGSVIGGRAILALDPAALCRLADGRRIALVSGTNGKTTTTSLLSAALAVAGPVVTNLLGANLPPGLAAALAVASTGADLCALEVDEAWLGQVTSATHPEVLVLLNLSRDQLDRNNEVRRLSARWREAIADATPGRAQPHVVANADDPLVAWAALAATSVTWVGAGQWWTADSAGCPGCGGRVRFDDGTGVGWTCSNCTLRRPGLDVWLDGGTVRTATGDRFPLHLQLPGRCNRANAAMAMAAAHRLGIEPAVALAAMTSTAEIVGRYRTITVGPTSARLLLAKNPAGWMEVFDLLEPAPGPVVVAINARIADGKDPSWLWDVPFERLRGRLVVAAGERSHDLAVRLHYADVEHRHVPDVMAAITAAGPGRVDVVANYTSFQTITRQPGNAA